MASFVYTVWSITNVASMHCAARPAISPCTCEPISTQNEVELSCEKVDSFNVIVDALSNKFTNNVSISLSIKHSQLEDLEMRSFNQMNLRMKKIKLISNNLKSLPELPFRGLSNVVFLSLAENELEEIPKHVLNHLPKISTLDLGKGRIRAVNHDDFKGIPQCEYLMLPSNNIRRIDRDAFPKRVKSLHLARNQITTLNGTLLELHDLETLFINMNNISTLENELPPSENLKMVLAHNNSLTSLPKELSNYKNLEAIYIYNNNLKSLNGILKHMQSLLWLWAFNNQIDYLAEDEFFENYNMEDIDLAYNNLKSLNSSLLNMRRLKNANFSFNQMEEFSMDEIRGLELLRTLDISYNLIEKLTGRQENIVEQNSFLVNLFLSHNRLKALDGALMGLNKLRYLNLTYNQIERILPDDFIGLENLETLDLSHNFLLTLEEFSTTFLPTLKNLKVSYNNLTKLDKDFHGLPVLCNANFKHNQIGSISTDLVSKTRCSNHGVPGKLEIWLEHNPIMCDAVVFDLCPIMDMNEARIRGQSECMEANSEVCTDQPIIIQAPLMRIPEILQTKLTNSQQPSLVQVIVPSPLAVPKSIIKAEFLQPITTTTTSTPAPIISTIPATPPAESSKTIKSISMNNTTISPTSKIIENSKNDSIETVKLKDLSEAIDEEIVIEKIPVGNIFTSLSLKPLASTTPLPEVESPTMGVETNTEYVVIEINEKAIEHLLDVDKGLPNLSVINTDDNSVNENFSVVLQQSPENAKLILTPEEPPETP